MLEVNVARVSESFVEIVCSIMFVNVIYKVCKVCVTHGCKRT